MADQVATGVNEVGKVFGRAAAAALALWMAVPASAWKYGRVVAVAEMPGGAAKDRAKMRRNVESVIQQLNDLGIVVEEWPGR